MPTVSIGMPVYNGAATIAAALDSLLAQTTADFDIIISDNCSADDTEAVCRSYVQRDSRVRYIRQPINIGASMNFRATLMAADAPYFMWAAADDLWAPAFIEKHLQALAAAPAAVASQSRVLFTKGGKLSHMSTGTYELVGDTRSNVARFLSNPADNSRYYGIFRTDVLQACFPERSFFALDWAVSVATLRYGTHLEVPQVLMIRDSSEATVYADAVSREHRLFVWRLFPILFMTKWLLLNHRIPINAKIAKSLIWLNSYIALRFGMYALQRWADRHLPAGSPIGKSVRFVVGPGLASRLRRLVGFIRRSIRASVRSVVRPIRRLARTVWRDLPLSLDQRESVKRSLVRRFGARALRFAGAANYQRVGLGAVEPIPTDPSRRGMPEDIWRLPGNVPASPALSIVLVAENGIERLLRVIDSVAVSPVSVEIVVVDNGSDDMTPIILDRLRGVVYRRFPHRATFGMAISEGLRHASASSVAVLASGVVPAPDFVSKILQGLESVPLLSAQIRDGDGFVRGEDLSQGLPLGDTDRLAPNHPLCLIHWPADEALGALAFRSDFLEQITPSDGAADFPMYSRLLFAAAAAKQIYAQSWPEAAVFRIDTASASVAGAHQTEPDHAIACLPLTPVMLFVDADTPMPDQNAGSIEALNFMHSMLDLGYRVLFVAESNFAYRGVYTDRLLELGINALYAEHFTSMGDVLDRFGSLLSLVVLCRPHVVTRYLDMVRQKAPAAKVVFYTIDLHFLREQRRAEIFNDPSAQAAADAAKQAELANIEGSDATIVLSTHEQQLLADLVPDANVHVLPMARQLPAELNVPGFAVRHDIVFVGTYQHPPNEDAVIHFCQDVWPHVHELLPDVRFLVVGSSLTQRVKALAASPGVEVLGYVEDLDALFGRSRLSVAPLRFGAGLKGKVISALQAGVPTIASSIAVEGFGMEHGRDLLVADDPQAMASAIVAAYTDENLWMRLSNGGFAFLKRECTLEANDRRIVDLLSGMGLVTFDQELHALEAELHSAGPKFIPSSYWNMLSQKNTFQIRSRELTHFKRNINNNYFQFLPGDVNDPQVHFLLEFCARHPSTLPDEAAESAALLSKNLRISSAFDYDPFSNLAYPAFYGRFVGMLWHFASFHDASGAYKTLDEPLLGGPIPIEVGGRRISQDLANSLLERGRIKGLLERGSPPERPRILEIGSGYGRLGDVLLRADNVRYAAVDIAPALAVAKWYLGNLYPKLKIFGFRHFENYEDVRGEIEEADICFFSANQIEMLPDDFADVGVAISCLHEMRHDQIALYLEALSRLSSRAVYMKNWTTWKNPADGIVVNRATFELQEPWHRVLDEAHPVNSEMWESGYVR